LFWWAFNGTVRAEYTTIALFRLKAGTAMSALVEKLAGIGGHGFFFFKTTLGTFDN